MRANLVAVPNSGLHDLPPRWGGRSVVWRGWEVFDGHICPPCQEACESCGSTDRPTLNVGMVGDDPDMTPEDVQRDDDLVRGGYKPPRTRRSWFRLLAFRCPECGADTVRDDEGRFWTLDLSDYGDRGSFDATAGGGGSNPQGGEK